MQTLHACSSAIYDIMELDEETIIVIGRNGEMTLLYSEADQEKEKDNSGDRLTFKMTGFPSLNNTVTCVSRCELDPEYRFLICLNNG